MSESCIIIIPEGYKPLDHKMASSSIEATEVKSSEVEESVSSISQPTSDKQTMASSII